MIATQSPRALEPERVPDNVHQVSDFVRGQSVTFADGNVTYTSVFAEDAWYAANVAHPGQRGYSTRLNFAHVPEWARYWTKRYVAFLWLGQGQSVGSLRRVMHAIRFLADTLSRMPGPKFAGPLAELHDHHGEFVAEEVAGYAARAQMVLTPLREQGASRRQVANALASAGVFSPGQYGGFIRALNAFIRWMRAEPNNIATSFHIRTPEALVLGVDRHALAASPKKVADETTITRILQACDAEYEAYARATSEYAEWIDDGKLTGREKRRLRFFAARRIRDLHSRAIMAQAVRLQLVSARRPAGVAVAPVDIPHSWDELDGQKVLVVRFTSYKMWGDQGLQEDVPCPGLFGEIAFDAIEKARELTAKLRTLAAPHDAQRLFIVPGKSVPRAITVHALSVYFKLAISKQRPGGLVQRYGIGSALDLTLHNARQTNVTRMVEAGAPVLLAARYLGHLVTNGNPLMASTFYVAGGTEAMRKSVESALKVGAASGLQFSPVARIMNELIGPEAVAAAIPSNELSLRAAILRLSGQDVVVDQETVTRERLVELLDEAIVLNVTAYGACMLRATTGPCPTAEQCPTGIYPDHPETILGNGCPHQVLLPGAVPRLREDLALIDLRIEEFERREGYGFWLARERRRKHIWERQLAVAEALEQVVISSQTLGNAEAH
jgi:hypothetical protein